QRGEQQHSKIKTCVLHCQFRFAKSLPLQSILNLRLDCVTVGRLPLIFPSLRNIKKVLGLIESLLGGGILSLRHDQSIEILGNGHGQSATRNFGLGICHGLGCFGPAVPSSHESPWREVLMKYSPGTINMYAIVSDESSVGDQSAVPLCPEILCRRGDRRKQGIPGLKPVLPGASRIRYSPQKLRINLSRSFQRVPQSYRDLRLSLA